MRVRDLDALGIELLDKPNHLFQMIKILPVHDQVHRKSDPMFADSAREFDFVGVGFSSGDPVGGVFAGVLKADLDVVETGIDQCFQALVIETDA